MKLTNEQETKLSVFLKRHMPCRERTGLRESSRIEGETVEGDMDVPGYRTVTAFIQRGLGDQAEVIQHVLSIVSRVQNDSNFEYPVWLYAFGWDDGLLHGKSRHRRGGPGIRCLGWVEEICELASTDTGPSSPMTPALFPPAVQEGVPLKLRADDLLIFFCKDRRMRLTEEARSRYAKPLQHAVWFYCEGDEADMTLGIREVGLTSAVDSKPQPGTSNGHDGQQGVTVDEYGVLVEDLLRVHLAKDLSLTPLITLLKTTGAPHKSVPLSYSTVIADTREKAFQRAIVLSGVSVLENTGTVNWLDIELPVIFGPGSRRPSLDLLGLCNDGRLVLCELKYGNSKNNPAYALFELLIYYYHIWRNAVALQKRGIWHAKMHKNLPPFDWARCTRPANVRLITAADDVYWKDDKARMPALQVACKIRNAVPMLSVNLFKAPPPETLFDVQSGGKRYMPTLGVNATRVWQEITQ